VDAKQDDEVDGLRNNDDADDDLDAVADTVDDDKSTSNK